MAKKGKKNHPLRTCLFSTRMPPALMWSGGALGLCARRSRCPTCAEISGVYLRFARLADWLTACRVTTVAMESTGVYWIPSSDPRARGLRLPWSTPPCQNVPGRPKTDRFDCRWLHKLHSYGLLAPSFRPLRTFASSAVFSAIGRI